MNFALSNLETTHPLHTFTDSTSTSYCSKIDKITFLQPILSNVFALPLPKVPPIPL